MYAAIDFSKKYLEKWKIIHTYAQCAVTYQSECASTASDCSMAVLGSNTIILTFTENLNDSKAWIWSEKLGATHRETRQGKWGSSPRKCCSLVVSCSRKVMWQEKTSRDTLENVWKNFMKKGRVPQTNESFSLTWEDFVKILDSEFLQKCNNFRTSPLKI